MRKTLIAVVLVAVVALVGLVGVANGAAPGDPLYGIDRSVETLRSRLALFPQDQVQVEINDLEERIQEAKDLLEREDTARLDEALGGLTQTVRSITLTAQATEGEQVQTVSEVLDKAYRDPGDGEEPEGSTYCDGTAAGQHPVAVKLAEYYKVSYEEVMSWHCAGYGFGEIAIAYGIAQQTGINVAEIFAMRDNGLGWGEILQASGLMQHPYKDRERVREVEPEAYPGPEEERGVCNREQLHPKAQELAAEFGVSAEEIMDWFCQGYGFGEIHLAYSIGMVKTVPVGEVFDQREGGSGWGEILQSYDLIGNPGKGPKEDREVNGDGNVLSPEDRGNNGGWKPDKLPKDKPKGNPRK